MIYFVKAGQFLKIGISENPEKRVRELQIGNPHKLELLGTIPGDEQDETEIHNAFSDHHSHGEWYFYSKPVRTFVKFAVGSPIEKTVITQGLPDGLAPPDGRSDWRIEISTRKLKSGATGTYWNWRRGSRAGGDSEYAPGGTIDTLPKEEAAKYVRYKNHYLLR